MNIRQLFVGLIVGLLAIASLHPAHAKDGVEMTGEQIRQALAGNQYRWRSGNGSGTVVYTKDGTASIRWANGGTTGRWSIKGNMVCVSWKLMRYRPECTTMHRLTNGTLRNYLPGGKWKSDIMLINKN